MRYVVLCIGSVSSEQYKQARLSLLRRGVKPKIVHIPWREFALDPENDYNVDGDVLAKRFGIASVELNPDENGDSLVYIEDLLKLVIVEYVPLVEVAAIFIGDPCGEQFFDDIDLLFSVSSGRGPVVHRVD